MKTVKKIVADELKAIGCNGLYRGMNGEDTCGCGIDELIVCEGDCSACVPAKYDALGDCYRPINTVERKDDKTIEKIDFIEKLDKYNTNWNKDTSFLNYDVVCGFCNAVQFIKKAVSAYPNTNIPELWLTTCIEDYRNEIENNDKICYFEKRGNDIVLDRILTKIMKDAE